MKLLRCIKRKRHPAGMAGAIAYQGRDARLADALGASILADGWGLQWSRETSGLWRAVVTVPPIPHAFTGRGGSRLVAISAAHLAALRSRAGLRRPHI
ncbi:hypothetical protein TA3x_004945 [Tundrisphaera sp. TA3]|uniref:hypothetical protein n=1 Tax=Tundrisphaera sp. TA3 TaxID=3435775 RepID=UPI003EB83FFF